MRLLLAKLLLLALAVTLAATPAAAQVYAFQVSPATVPAGASSNVTVTITFDYFSFCVLGTQGSAAFRWTRSGFADVTTAVVLPSSFGGNLLTASLTIPSSHLQSPGSGSIVATSVYSNGCVPVAQGATNVGTVTAVAPVITKPIVPTATSSGGASLPITVYGDNFVPGQSKIAFDGTSLTSTAVAGKVTASIPGGSLTAGVHKVRIRNNDAIATNPPDSTEVDFLVGTATTTTVTSSTSAAVLGQSTTLTATVTGGSSPTGSVTFYDGAQVLGTSSLSGGAATLATRFLTSGVRRIRAIYHGNSSSAPSQSAVFNQTVQGLGATGFLSAAGSPVAVGGRPFGLASGDFNEDGRLDLAVPNVDSNSVSILLGNSSGGFTAGTAVTSIFGSGGEPTFVATGDFNQDGNVDFVVSSNSSRGARVYQGNGAGSFSPLTTLDLPTDARPLGLAVADFNSDGIPDIAVVDHSSTERLYVFLSAGDGTFAAVPAVFLLNNSDPWVPVAADFDNDGRIDLAIPNRATGIDSVSVYRGVGDGTFLAAVNYSTGSGSRPAMAAVGDFDQNGQPDIVTANAGGGSVSVLLNNGGGTFGAPSVFSTGTGAAGVAVQDFNGDGLLDIASVNFTAGNVTILINDLSNRGQNFTNQTRYSFPAGSSAGYLVTGDFNRDGRPDMALTLANPSGTVSVGLGTGPGITSLSRTSAVAGTPGLTFNINGSNFITGSKVRWDRGGTISLIPDDGGSVTFVSASQLTVAIPVALLTTPNSTTSVDVAISVVDPLAAASEPTTFTVTPGPVVSSVTPDLPLVTGGGNRTLVVGGLNFATGSILRWRVGGVTTNLSTSRQSVAQLTGTLPGSLITSAGTAFVSVLDLGGATSPEFSVTVAAPPALSALAPFLAGGGSAALTITLTGSGFSSTSQVRWCNSCGSSPTSLPTTFVSATQLTATISAPLLAAAGTASVTVFDTASTASTSAQTFTISTPAISTLTPVSATAGAAAFTLTITGSGFVPGATVQWCNACAGSFTDLTTNFVDAQSLTATVTSGLLAAAGTVTVRVANNSTVVSSTRTFSIVPVSLSSVNPNVVLAGTSSFAFTLTGQNFQPGAVVLWNNGASTGPITITPTINSGGTQASATLPSNVALTAGVVQVSLRNPDGVTTAPLPITVVPLIINSDGLSPAARTAGSSSFVLTVTGENFTNAATVRWTFGSDTVSLPTTFVDSKTLTAVVDGTSRLAIAGKATVSVVLNVNTPAAVQSNSVIFSVDGPAIISATPPSSAVAAPAFTIAIRGSNFLNGSTAQWKVGSAPVKALATNFVDDQNLTAVITGDLVAASTVALLSVQNPGGSVSNGLVFPVGVVPTLTGLTPASVAAGSPAFALTVTGTNFDPGSVVQWTAGDTTTPLPTGFVDATTLTASVKASLVSTPGFALLSVLNKGDLKSNVVSLGITGAAPVLSSLSQNSAPAGSSGVTLTVTGTGFSAGSSIIFGTTSLPTSVVSSAQATATIPPSLLTAAGPVNVSVQNAAGTSSPLNFSVVGPTVVLLNPTATFRGAPGFTLTVGGANFVSGSVVNWGTTPLTTTFVSSSQLTALVPASLLVAPGAVNVLVQNPGGSASSTAAFAVGDTATVTTLSPISAPAGAGAVVLLVSGTNFTALDTVLWNGLPLATSFASAAQLTASVPANFTATPATVNISVLRSGGSLSNAASFLILGPTLTTLNPTSAPVGATAFQISATGQNFVNGTVLQWNGTPLPTTFVSATQLNAVVDASFLQAAGPAFLSAVNPGGARSESVRFNVVSPTLSNLAPASITAGAAAFTLTVSGTNFVTGSAVSWNGTALLSSFLSPTQLSAQVPANLVATAGSAIVQVVSAGGNATTPLTFTIGSPNAPLVSALSPASTVAGSSAFQLTVNGSGFVSGAVVQWNGAPLATNFVSNTQLIALVDSTLVASSGTANVTVQSPGAPLSASLRFTINPPLITTLTPTTVSAGSQGFNVTVIGLNFVPGSLVQWNATTIPTAFISSTQLTGAVPTAFLASAGTVSVTVQNPGGAVSAGTTFTIGPFNLSVSTTSLPDALVGGVYSQVLSAAGGSPPYTWALTSGAFPDGLTLDSSGRISGTPTAAATATLTVTVTDSAGRAIARTMSLRAVGALQIITESPLTGGLIGTTYSAILQASGGTPPFLWSLTSPPRGLSINGNTGEISGRLQQSGIQRFSATVSDSRQQTFTREYELVVLDLPAITLAAPDDSESAQQPTISVSLPNPYPVPITGVLTLTFTANSSIPRVSGRVVDDPAVQFSTGSRRVTYTIAPGETQARFGETRDRELFLSTGTVAGAISVSGTVRVGTTDLSLAEPLQKTIAVATAKPVVTSLIVAPAAGGLAVTISGYSNTRELSQASFAFAAISGSTLASSEVTLNLASVFSGWYSSTASIASGSQFTITIPFTITGDVKAIASVAVTLTNSKGKSAAVSSSTR